MNGALTEQRQGLGSIFSKCWSDEAFKQRFLSNPKAVLTEHGFEVPDDLDIGVVENSDQKVFITLPVPSHPSKSDLSEHDLQIAPCRWGMCKPKGSTGN